MPTLADPLFTDAEAQRVRDVEPTFSDRPPGVDLPAKMEALRAAVIAELAAVAALHPAGEATVLNGTATVIVSGAALAGLDGSPVVAVLGEPDGAVHVLSCEWNGDDTFDINLSAVTTADRTVYWMVNAS